MIRRCVILWKPTCGCSECVHHLANAREIMATWIFDQFLCTKSIEIDLASMHEACACCTREDRLYHRSDKNLNGSTPTIVKAFSESTDQKERRDKRRIK